jgi:hypothetical protein
MPHTKGTKDHYGVFIRQISPHGTGRTVQFYPQISGTLDPHRFLFFESALIGCVICGLNFRGGV